jgi:hypothetical protein
MSIRAKIYGGASAAEDPILKAKKPKGARLAVKREAHRASNARGEDRHRLSKERAQISFKGAELEIELINLSGGGAMIAGSFEPRLWDRIDLRLGNHGTIECAVRWIRDGRVGLEFAHETRLDWPSDQVAIVLRHVIERSFPHITFPESAVPEPKAVEPSRTNEHRAAPRHPLIWNGTLHHDFQSSAVRIRNISSTGAMIETAGQVSVGAEPLLELSESVALPATVEWAIGDQVGLKFHSEFDMNMLAESKPSVATGNWTPPAYLDADANDEDRWGRLNLHQLRQELEGFLKR